jgi:hypothetical protein
MQRVNLKESIGVHPQRIALELPHLMAGGGGGARECHRYVY